MEQRIKAINPEINLTAIKEFQTPEMMKEILKKKYTYIIDAIDSISPKLHLIQHAYYNGRRIISSMGAGGKMDPTKLLVDDISKTDICPLAQYVRKRLKYMGIYNGVKSVYSKELPAKILLCAQMAVTLKNRHTELFHICRPYSGLPALRWLFAIL